MTEEKTSSPARSGLRAALNVSTLIYLLVASMLVGFVLATLGLNPVDFWRGLVRGIGELFRSLIDLGWGAIYSIISYVLLGAVIVVPIWLIIQLTNRRK